jgi:membrane associated rhomboid family serine protease
LGNKSHVTWFKAAETIGVFTLLIWIAHLLNTFTGHRLDVFGIYPRKPEMLPGVILWPFLHANFNHIILNTTPLLFMGFLVALRGRGLFIYSSLLIVVVGGLGVWVFGRPAFHIGASGLVFGYFGFLVAIGIYERSFSGLAIASLTLFYYGSIIFGVLPTNSFVSWEGHLFGLFAGIIAARVFANPRGRKRTS